MLIDGFLIWQTPGTVHVRGEHPKLRAMIDRACEHITEPAAWDAFWNKHAKAYESYLQKAWLKYCSR
jgi:hypothetical protein